MKIEILGSGCPKCRALGEAAEAAAKQLGLDYTMEKVTDINKITAAGVMMTPALVVDGVIKSSGKLPSPEEMAKLLAG